MQAGSTAISRAPRPSSLADVLDLILDKGLVIDAYVRVSLAGIELLTVDARIVVASVDTYLRFAEAVNRLDLGQTEQAGLPAFLGGNGRESSDGHGDGHSGEVQARRDHGSARALGRGAGGRTSESGQDGPAVGTDDEEPGVLDRIAQRARFTR